MKDYDAFLTGKKLALKIEAKKNLIGEPEFEKMFDYLCKVIQDLKQIRDDWGSTSAYLQEIKEEMDVNNELHYILFSHWILETIKDDETFIFAYNHIAKERNNRNGYSGYKEKEIDVSNLKKLIEAEGIKQNEVQQLKEAKQKQIQPVVEMPSILAIIQETTHTKFVMQHYERLCALYESKNLFSILMPYNNIYMLSNVSKELFNNDLKFYYEDDRVKDEIELYCDGFLNGYNNFLNKLKKNPASYQIDVFDAIISFSYRKTIKPYIIDENNLICFSPQMDFYGKRIGKYYAAWCIVLESQRYFEPLFENEFKPIEMFKSNQLQTKLTDTQRGKLFDLLVGNGFINTTDKEGFIWAFGGVNDNYTSFSTKWLKTLNLSVYLIDKLCYDPTASTHFWAIGERIFSNVKGMRKQKQMYLGNGKQNKPNDPASGKPKGYELIDNIILEAQK